MSEQIIRISAPGKVILHGEHSVVYGKKAIAVSVGLLTTVTIVTSNDVKINFPDVGIDTILSLEKIHKLKGLLRADFTYEVLNSSEQIPIWQNVQNVLEKFCDTEVNLNCIDEDLKPAQRAAFHAVLFLYLSILDYPIGLDISVHTELPVGAGLGSSASFAVALAGAILIAGNRISRTGELSSDLINRWAFVSEKFVHGTPSGIDNTVCTFGAGVIFQKGKAVELIQEFPAIRVLLVNTKIPRSTKVLVDKVAKLKETNNGLFNSTIDGIETVVESAIREIKENRKVVSGFISKNHEYLKTLGVSHPSLEFIVELAREYSFGAKLTGAGGGGCAFILIPDDVNEESVLALVSTLEKTGLELWDTKLGCPGVTRC